MLLYIVFIYFTDVKVTKNGFHEYLVKDHFNRKQLGMKKIFYSYEVGTVLR